MSLSENLDKANIFHYESIADEGYDEMDNLERDLGKSLTYIYIDTFEMSQRMQVKVSLNRPQFYWYQTKKKAVRESQVN